jgi:hypothetical protein
MARVRVGITIRIGFGDEFRERMRFRVGMEYRVKVGPGDRVGFRRCF